MNALSLINCASEINAAHQQAIQHADRAIEFARQAGDLLLKVKADLPHGDFLPWVEANCTVSQRQAQRYMAAAQGKPIPLRAIKNDTVSHLPEAPKPPETKIVYVKYLTPKQKAAKLERCERQIHAYYRKVYEAGAPLREIRDKKLYLERNPSFEAYCLDRFDLQGEDLDDRLVLRRAAT